MYIVLSFVAAVTSGVAVIFQKKGTYGKNMIQISATHLLALFVTVLCVTLLKGELAQFALVPGRSWLLAAVSGLVQAGSWVAYFFAMEKANVSFLMVLDKTGIIVTMVLAAVFLDERITLVMLLGGAFVLVGTALMGDLKGAGCLSGSGNRWILWGIVSPSLQAVSNILAALDTAPVDTAVTSTIRMLVIVVCLCILAAIRDGSFRQLGKLGHKRLFMLVAGGVILGASYLLMYKAYSMGKASTVAAIVRANFLVTTLLAGIVFHEHLSPKGVAGFIAVCAGVTLFVV